MKRIQNCTYDTLHQDLTTFKVWAWQGGNVFIEKQSRKSDQDLRNLMEEYNEDHRDQTERISWAELGLRKLFRNAISKLQIKYILRDN